MNKVALLIFILFFGGCASPSKTPSVGVESEYNSGLNLITFYVEKKLMAHDPISLIMGSTYIEAYHLRVKEKTGIISAKDIQIIKLEDFGTSHRVQVIEGASGQITIHRNIVDVELEIPITIGKTIKHEAFEFNGQHNLESHPVR